MRILIAEDERITRASLARQLQSWGHAVEQAEDGERAWALFDRGQFDIVLTDWDMPRLSGLELIQRIRSAAKPGFAYVVMLTGHTEKSDVVRGIEAGADDFLSKPFDRDELRVRLFAGERIVRLERTLSARNLELHAASEKMRGDLRAAARLQRAMLPRAAIATPRVRTAWTYVPTDELAGDAVGFHLIDDRYLAFYVVDVSGHGVPAALLAVRLLHAMSPIAEGAGFASDLSGRAGTPRPARVITELNRRFSTGDLDGRFLTMLLCTLDTHLGSLHVAQAGHPLPIILRGDRTVAVPDNGGLPLGLSESEEYQDSTLQLQPGDRVCVFSDGFLEQSQAGGSALYGQSRLTELLTRGHAQPGDRLVEEAVESLAAWAGTRSFADDLSLLIVDWLGGPP